MPGRQGPARRRVLAGAAAVAAGLAAVVCLATPAGAHEVDVDGQVSCDDTVGMWRVTWRISNSHGSDATLTGVAATPASPVDFTPDSDGPAAGTGTGAGSGAATGTEDGEAGSHAGPVVPGTDGDRDPTIVGVQFVPAGVSEATLDVDAIWPRDRFRGHQLARVALNGTCGPAKPCVHANQATFRHTFDGPKGTATIALAGDRPMCPGEGQDFTLVSYFAPKPKFSVPQYAFDWTTVRISYRRPSASLQVQVPRCNTQVDFVLGGAGDLIDPLDGTKLYGNTKVGSSSGPGKRSAGPPAWYNGGTGTCAQPQVEFVPACDGSLIAHLSNTSEGRYDAPFVVTAPGGFSADAAVPPGEASDILIPAESAGEVTVTMDGKVVGSGAWTRPPDCVPPTVTAESDCASLTVTVANPVSAAPLDVTATPSSGEARTIHAEPGGSGSATFAAAQTGFTVSLVLAGEELVATFAKPTTCPATTTGGGAGTGDATGVSVAGVSLPLTGARIAWIASVAAVLLGAGGGLYLAFRRRRIRFVAR